MKKQFRRRRKQPMPPKPHGPKLIKRQMTPEEYLAGWRERKTWTHLDNEKHQTRLKWCAGKCVGETFVDVGCALGHSTAIMHKKRRGAWTGIEFEEAAVEEARRNFSEIAFIYAPSVEDLWRTGRYDSVVCSEVIEHVEDPEVLLIGLLTIATRRVIITTPCMDVNDPGHVRLYDDGMLGELLAPYRHQIYKDDLFYKVVIEVGGDD